MLDLFGFGRRGRRGNGASPPMMPRHAIHPGWPESTQSVTVNRSDGAGDMVLRLRPLVRGDFQDWQDMRIADQHILQPVEPTVMGDWEDAHSKRQWWQQLLQLRSAADAGTVVPLAIEVNGRFAGQLTLGAIQHGVGSDCWVGYWRWVWIMRCSAWACTAWWQRTYRRTRRRDAYWRKTVFVRRATCTETCTLMAAGRTITLLLYVMMITPSVV